MTAEARLGLERGALVAVVLARPVLAPLDRIGVVLSHLHEANVGDVLLGLALEDVDEQRRHPCRHGRDGGDDREVHSPLLPERYLLRIRGHSFAPWSFARRSLFSQIATGTLLLGREGT